MTASTRVRKPSAPSGLGPRARAFWKVVTDGWLLDVAALELLRQAVEALDRAERCREVVNAEGESTVDRYGSPKVHPVLQAENSARTTFAKLVAQLGLEEAPDLPGGGR